MYSGPEQNCTTISFSQQTPLHSQPLRAWKTAPKTFLPSHPIQCTRGSLAAPPSWPSVPCEEKFKFWFGIVQLNLSADLHANIVKCEDKGKDPDYPQKKAKAFFTEKIVPNIGSGDNWCLGKRQHGCELIECPFCTEMWRLRNLCQPLFDNIRDTFWHRYIFHCITSPKCVVGELRTLIAHFKYRCFARPKDIFLKIMLKLSREVFSGSSLFGIEVSPSSWSPTSARMFLTLLGIWILSADKIVAELYMFGFSPGQNSDMFPSPLILQKSVRRWVCRSFWFQPSLFVGKALLIFVGTFRPVMVLILMVRVQQAHAIWHHLFEWLGRA